LGLFVIFWSSEGYSENLPLYGCSFFPFWGCGGERADLTGEALIYKIHPLESEIGGFLLPPLVFPSS